MREHLIFYDGECPFCNFWVQRVIKIDVRRLFTFAPLQGKTAASHSYVHRLRQKRDSLILLENYKSKDETISIEAKAVLRICWLLGGGYAFLGLFSFLPSYFFNWIYRLVAKNRSSLFTNCSLTSISSDRFLE